MRLDTYRLSENSARTSFRYELRMFSTEKTKTCSKLSAASWTLAKSFWESSLPFLSVWVRWTTLARLDLGILAVLLRDWGGRMRSEKKFEFAKSQAKNANARRGKRANTDTPTRTLALASAARLAGGISTLPGTLPTGCSLCCAADREKCWISWRMCRMPSTTLRIGTLTTPTAH